MQIDVLRADVTAQVAEGPSVFISLQKPPGDGLWRICQEPLPGSGNLWGIDKLDQLIRIPLFGYLLRENSPEALTHFGAQIGSLAVATLRRFETSRIILVLGNVFERPDARPGLQAWAGFAACSPQI